MLAGATVCLMRICDYKFAVYGFFAEHSGYQSWLDNYVISKWGDSLITDVRPRPVELWPRSQPLAAKSKVHIRGLLRILWDHAMWSESIPTQRNPMELVAIASATTGRVRKPRSLTVEEFQTLLKTVGNDVCFRTMILICIILSHVPLVARFCGNFCRRAAKTHASR